MGIINAGRGQSEVVGAILLFGIFILAIGLLQTYFVPKEIAATEQNHVEEVSDDFTEMYASIGDAAGSNRERSASISLGTRYGVSTVFLTPPPARGTIESEHIGNLSSDNGDEFSGLGGELVNEVCGLSTVKTNAITYEARYNEYRNAGAHTYEAGVHYRITDSAGLKNSQRLVDDESDVTTIHLTPITNGSIRESGTSREPITFKPGVTGETGIFAGASDPVSIAIPVRNSDGWNASFSDSGIVDMSSSHANLTFDNSSQDYRIRCTPIGINTNPGNDPADEFTGDEDEDEEDTGGINPIGDGALVLEEGSNASTLSFNNTGESKKIVTKVRIPWLQEPGEISNGACLKFENAASPILVETGSTTWSSTGGWEWGTEDSTEKKIIDAFEKKNKKDCEDQKVKNSGNPNTGYAIVFQFNDGTTATYLVSG